MRRFVFNLYIMMIMTILPETGVKHFPYIRLDSLYCLPIYEGRQTLLCFSENSEYIISWSAGNCLLLSCDAFI